MKAGNCENRAISHNDTTFVAVHKLTPGTHFTNLNTIEVKKPFFAAMPDTTIDIVIIYRRVFASVTNNKTQYK
jgi:hypothetical protein